MWGFPSLDSLWQDLRYGVRLLRRSPMFTFTSILSLAIGIGASAAVFSLADRMLVQMLPVRAPEELVIFRWHSGPVFPFSSLNGNASQNDDGLASTSFSLDAFRRVRAEASQLVDVFGFAGLDRVNLSIDGVADLGEAEAVSGNYFSVLGVSPSRGRPLLDTDDSAEAPPAAVISDSLWKRRFGGSDGAIGRTLFVNGAAFAVVGVIPPSFHGTGQVGTSPDLYVPIASRDRIVRFDDKSTDVNFWWILMMGRLERGVTSDRVQPRIDAIVKQSTASARPALGAKDLPHVDVASGARGQVEVREGMREPLRIMAIVVGIVLLVACANVASLLVARGRARLRELSVRIALGAPRRRVVRQLVTEGVLLVAGASAGGILAARWIAAGLLPALQQGPDPMTLAAGLSPRLIAFVAGLAGVCVVLFALAPALRASDVTLVTGLHEAGRGSSSARYRGGLSTGLIVAQITMSMVLVTSALLLVRSIRQLERVDLGFDARNLLLFKVDPTLNGYQDERVGQIYEDILERLRAAPAVMSATLSSHTLISNSSSIGLASRVDEAVPNRGSAESVAFRAKHSAFKLTVDPQFFATMGIKIERGRALDDRDSARTRKVAVINHALARQLFDSDDVVGRRFRTGMTPEEPDYQIVGVSADARYTSLRRPKPPTMYLPYRQHAAGAMTVEVRTAGDPRTFAATAREIVRSVDRNLPLFRVQSQEEQIAASLQRERLFATLASWLGAVTVALSAIGLYALLAYAVTRRTGEIGIRMTLGAGRSDVRWMIVRQSLVLAAWGLAFGVVASAVGTRMLEALLFNVAARDPLTVALAAAIMLTVCVVAGYLPARRASRVDPMVALRAE
jgi:predicted permease